MISVFGVVVLGCLALSASIPYREGRSESVDVSFIGEGTNDLATALLQGHAEKEEDMVFSPFSYSVLLAVFAEGARGKSREEIAEVLHFPEDVDAVRLAYKTVLERFVHRKTSSSPEFKNWFYIYKNYTVNKELEDVLRKYYLTDVRSVHPPEMYLEDMGQFADGKPGEKTAQEVPAEQSTESAKQTSPMVSESVKESSVKPTKPQEEMVKEISEAKPAKPEEMSEPKPTKLEGEVVKEEMNEAKPTKPEEEMVKVEMSEPKPAKPEKEMVKVEMSEAKPAKPEEEMVKEISEAKPAKPEKEMSEAKLTKPEEEMVKEEMSEAKPTKLEGEVVKEEMSEAKPTKPEKEMVKVEMSEPKPTKPEEEMSEAKPTKPEEEMSEAKPTKPQVESTKEEETEAKNLKLEKTGDVKTENTNEQKEADLNGFVWAMDTSLRMKNEDSKPRMVIFNGLYYKGEWETPFAKKRADDSRPFYKSDGEKVFVSTIHSQGVFNFGDLSDLDCRAIELPYKGGRYSLLVLVPNEKNGLTKLVSDLSGYSFRGISDRLSLKLVDVCLPSFHVKTIAAPIRPQRRLGLNKVTSIFNPETADLTGVSANVTGLFVEELVQMVTFKVDSEYSKADFLTASIASSRSNVPSFQINRPFLFYLRDNIDGIIIVNGKVLNPTPKPSDYYS